MAKSLTAIMIIVFITGCATGHIVHVSDSKIKGPRVIALDAPSAPWVVEVQNRLKAKGFRVL